MKIVIYIMRNITIHFRKTSTLKREKIFVHMNMMISMLLAYIFLLVSDAATTNYVSNIAIFFNGGTTLYILRYFIVLYLMY